MSWIGVVAIAVLGVAGYWLWKHYGDKIRAAVVDQVAAAAPAVPGVVVSEQPVAPPAAPTTDPRVKVIPDPEHPGETMFVIDGVHTCKTNEEVEAYLAQDATRIEQGKITDSTHKFGPNP